jgi:hypothetical protein
MVKACLVSCDSPSGPAVQSGHLQQVSLSSVIRPRVVRSSPVTYSKWVFHLWFALGSCGPVRSLTVSESFICGVSSKLLPFDDFSDHKVTNWLGLQAWHKGSVVTTLSSFYQSWRLDAPPCSERPQLPVAQAPSTQPKPSYTIISSLSLLRNRKFCKELIYFPLIRHGLYRKRSAQQFHCRCLLGVCTV